MQDTYKARYIKLYETESDRLFRYCILRVSDREQAVDLVQQAFMKLWNEMGKSQEIQNLRAFLFSIINNLIIDWYRKKKAVSLDAMIDGDNVMGGENDIGFQIADTHPHNNPVHIEMNAEARLILEKIKELDKTYQQAVYLRFVEDLPPKDIAEILGLTANVASVRIHRGIEELKKLLHLYEKY